MTDKHQRLRDALAAGPTPGPWIHLFGDRFIYTRLEDGCRGTPVVGVDYASAGNFPTLKYIAAADPKAIAALLAERDALREFAKAVVRYAGSAGDDYLADKARAAMAKEENND